jgi:uncharacterized protein YhjY with autotransporter beta-barrel domain
LEGGQDEYELQKFMRLNQGTLIHQKQIVDGGFGHSTTGLTSGH